MAANVDDNFPSSIQTRIEQAMMKKMNVTPFLDLKVQQKNQSALISNVLNEINQIKEEEAYLIERFTLFSVFSAVFLMIMMGILFFLTFQYMKKIILRVDILQGFNKI